MHFEKVTREQWTKDMMDLYQFENPSKEHLEEINNLYDNITLPKRATKHSAGYDFYVSVLKELIKFPLRVKNCLQLCKENQR